METFSALLALYEWNAPVTGEFPSKRLVTRSFDVFFDLHLNKRLSKQSRCWWFETPCRPLWRHCNELQHIARRVCVCVCVWGGGGGGGGAYISTDTRCSNELVIWQRWEGTRKIVPTMTTRRHVLLTTNADSWSMITIEEISSGLSYSYGNEYFQNDIRCYVYASVRPCTTHHQ